MIYVRSLHDALPISSVAGAARDENSGGERVNERCGQGCNHPAGVVQGNGEERDSLRVDSRGIESLVQRGWNGGRHRACSGAYGVVVQRDRAIACQCSTGHLGSGIERDAREREDISDEGGVRSECSGTPDLPGVIALLDRKSTRLNY